jgi:hypothetical protein
LSNEEGRRTGRGTRQKEALQKNLTMRILGGNEPADAFIDDTAKQTGKARATIARDANRGKEGMFRLGTSVAITVSPRAPPR